MENSDSKTVKKLLEYFSAVQEKLIYRLEVKVNQIKEIAPVDGRNEDVRNVSPSTLQLPSITKFERHLKEEVNKCSNCSHKEHIIYQCLDEYYNIEPYLVDPALLFDYGNITDFIERDSIKLEEYQEYEKKSKRENSRIKNASLKIEDHIEIINKKCKDNDLKEQKLQKVGIEVGNLLNNTINNLEKVRENLLTPSRLPDRKLIKLSAKPITATSIKYYKYMCLLKDYAQKTKDTHLWNFISYERYAEKLLRVITDCAKKERINLQSQSFVKRIIKIDLEVWNVFTLTKLYNLLVEREYIESEKCEAFISIFHETYSDFHQLPIRWLAPEICGGNDTNSNQTLLYNLLAGIKNWKKYQDYYNDICKYGSKVCFSEYVPTIDKKIWASCFVLINGDEINYRNLRIRPNIQALGIIKDIIDVIMCNSN